MIWRHEEKYILNPAEVTKVRSRIQNRMTTDEHHADGKYLIASIYFDDFRLSAVREKAAGLAEHTKYRIRTYNGDKSRISLEKKVKKGIMTSKTSAIIDEETFRDIMAGAPDIRASETARQLYTEMRTAGLRPKCLVKYRRQAFTFDPLDIRVTFDSEVAYLPPDPELLLNPDMPEGILSISPEETVLEVKYNRYMPYDIRLLTQTREMQSSFSKYAACMMHSGQISMN